MRVPRSLGWRVALAYTALLVASLGASSIYLVGFVRGTYLDQLHERVEQEARLIGQAALPFLGERDDPEELQRVVDRSAEAVAARVTIIAPDGRVVADSAQDAALMENHRNRAEVAQAIEQGIGSAQRVSVSVGTPLDYTALRLVDDGRTVGVVRLAVSQDEVDRNLRRIMSTVAIVGMVVSLLAMGLGALLVRRTVRSVRTVTEGARRLGAGDLDHRVRAEALDETDELARTFNIMADRLRSTVNDLSAQRNTLSAVLDTMTDGVVLVDGTGQLEVANAAARQLLALDPRQATRSDFMSVIRDHDLGRLIQVCRATAVRQQADIELPFGHGYLYAVATPLADVGNGGILLMIHDLTELRRIDVTRREFVSNVSHELRTPIASIKAMAETLGGAALADQGVARDFVARIHREADRMADLVSDLLMLSRIEAGLAVRYPERLALGDLVIAIVSDFEERARSKQIEITTAVPIDLPTVLGDAGQLRVLVGNLLDNAIKFTPVGGHIVVRAWEAAGAIHVAVEDTGLGIAEEHLSHVFERFYKADRSRSDAGTGLGLSIARHVVKAHGGMIAVRRNVGSGTTFEFSIPVTLDP